MSPGVSCPWCGGHGTSTVVDHEGGRFACSCGSLHNGTGTEWQRLAKHRRLAIERKAEWMAKHPQVDRVADHVFEEAS